MNQWTGILHWLLLLFTGNYAEISFLNRIICRELNDTTVSSLCVVKEEPVEWPSSNDITAPEPEAMDANWFIDRNLNLIRFNITWLQKGTVVKDLVDGYHLNVGMWDSMKSLNFHILLNKIKLNELQPTAKIAFEYVDYARCDSVNQITPGMRYFFALESLPVYHKETDSLFVEESLRIPDCEEDPKVNSTLNCQRVYPSNEELGQEVMEDPRVSMETLITRKPKRRPTTGDRTNRRISSNSYLPKVISVSGVVVVLTFTILFAVSMYRRSNTTRVFTIRPNRLKVQRGLLEGNSRRRVLMLVGMYDSHGKSLYWEVAGRLATILQECGKADVTFNLWERTKISNPYDWVSNNFLTNDHVVFFFTPPAKSYFSEESLEDSFLVGVKQRLLHQKRQTLSNLRPKIQFSGVYCDAADNCIDIPIKSYELMRNFDKFYFYITGHSSKTVPPLVRGNLEKAVSSTRSQPSS